MRRRLQNAAERQGGEPDEAEVRGEKARFRARKSRSDVRGSFEVRGLSELDDDVDDCGGLDSMLGTRLRGGIIAYRRLMISLKSMSRASPRKVRAIG